MTDSLPYLVIAFYAFETIADPHAEVTAHRTFLQNLDATARIYISEEGINAQMSASQEAGHAYMNWIRERAPFQYVDFKIQSHHEHAFPRLTIKYRKQLVALDCKVDLSQRGTHVSPEEWKQMLDTKEEECLLLDVRNDYECKVGHFEGAELPPCSEFREFTRYVKNLKDRVNPKKTPVMMYCTGGIRCEVFSALMKQEGFETIYQLDGGVLKYAEKVGNAHWLGKLFVFDDRLTVPLASEAAPIVGKCHHCSKPSEAYYNCASLDCNVLYLCCPECLVDQKGCCQTSCQESPRLRPISHLTTHKPFRRWHHYATEKNELWHLRPSS